MDERQKFEAWVMQAGNSTLCSRWFEYPREYIDARIEFAWKAWQAGVESQKYAPFTDCFHGEDLANG